MNFLKMNIACLGREKATIVPTPYRGLRILLVDKDPQSLLSIASVLEEQSYRVTTTELESKALSILQEGTKQFDLVMADVNGAKTDCLKFMESIQLIRDLPIILMSYTAKKELVKEAMLNGACFFFRKPLSKEQLKNVWQHVCRKRRREIMEAENAANKNQEEEEEEEEVYSRGYEDEEVDSMPRIVCENKFNDTNNEHAGPKERIRNDGTNSDEIENDKTQQYDSSMYISAETDAPEGSKRRRLGNDECREVKLEPSESEQSSSTDSRALTGEEKRMKSDDKDNGTLEKKSRMCWTPDLQLKFREAISALGEEARPKRVLEMMNIPNLTQRQVASHLQKFRARAQCSEFSGAIPSPVQTRIPTSSGRNESIQKSKKQNSVRISQGPETSKSQLGVHLKKSPNSVSHPLRAVGSVVPTFGKLNHQSEYGESSPTLSAKYHPSQTYGANRQLNCNKITCASRYGGILESSSQELNQYHASSDSEDVEVAFNRMVHPNCNNHDETQAVHNTELHKTNWNRENGNILLDVLQRDKGKRTQHLDLKPAVEYSVNATKKLPAPMNPEHNHEAVSFPLKVQQQLDLSPAIDDHETYQNPYQLWTTFTELLQKTDIRRGLFPFEGLSYPNNSVTEFSDVMHELPGSPSPSYSINQRQNLPNSDNEKRFSKRDQEAQDNHQQMLHPQSFQMARRSSVEK